MLLKKLIVHVLKTLVLVTSMGMDMRIYCFEDPRLEEQSGEWWYEHDGLDNRDISAIKDLIVRVLQGKKQPLDMGTVRSQLVLLIDDAIEQKSQVEQLQSIQ